MKVLVNATTLVKGGGIQVAASFMAESTRDPAGVDWHYAVTSEVAEELGALGVEPVNLTVFAVSPARDAAQRERLLGLERELVPDVVFTVFGPAYVRFAAPHLCGVAVGWVTHSTWRAYATLDGWLARLRTLLKCIYKGYWLRYADRWVVEAENARQGLHTRMRIPLADIDVVANTCAAVFRAADIPVAAVPESDEPIRLLYVSAYYPHKYIEFIPEVAAQLARMGLAGKYQFVVTLPDDEPGLRRIMTKAKQLGVSSMLVNAGRLSLKGVIEQYKTAHLCFMPSLLETFSATYPEAMALGRPIVTSDLDFARAVCGDAALYFEAGNSRAAADAIVALTADRERWAHCINSGHAVLAELPDARRKYQLYVEALQATADAGKQ